MILYNVIPIIYTRYTQSIYIYTRKFVSCIHIYNVIWIHVSKIRTTTLLLCCQSDVPSSAVSFVRSRRLSCRAPKPSSHSIRVGRRVTTNVILAMTVIIYNNDDNNNNSSFNILLQQIVVIFYIVWYLFWHSQNIIYTFYRYLCSYSLSLLYIIL
jgi:hypothetical protein